MGQRMLREFLLLLLKSVGLLLADREGDLPQRATRAHLHLLAAHDGPALCHVAARFSRAVASTASRRRAVALTPSRRRGLEDAIAATALSPPRRADGPDVVRNGSKSKKRPPPAS